MKFEKIILAAHRGDRKNHPENTMPAFEAAIKENVDMIETDIHMTADGELIIMHDLSTERTTGYQGFTNEMTLAEIRQLDAGYGFYKTKTDICVPTVREFIEFIKDTDVLVNWELKDYPKDVGDQFAFEAADKLIALIEEYDMAERSMVNSFSNRVLEHIYLKCGHRYSIHGQGICKCTRSNDIAETPDTELFDWCCLYPDEPGKNPLDYADNFEYCIANGIQPCVCLPDTMEIYSKAIQLGCRMFTSNDIYEAGRILKQLNER